jgi:hypothetical protein
MKKNKIFYSVATAAATLVMTAAPMVSTFAAVDASLRSDTSHATFTVDPTKSTVDVPDTDKPDTNQTGDGALQLTAVPGFDFGTIGTTDLITGKDNIPVADEDANAGTKSEAKDASGAWIDASNPNHHLAVSDLRGSNAGWTLTASMTPFVNDDDADVKITGQLNLAGNAAKLATDYTGYDPSLQTLGDAFRTLKAAIPATSTTDVPTSATVYDAVDGTGAGINVANTDDSTLNLEPSTDATAGHYTATITWTLSSVTDEQPAN